MTGEKQRVLLGEISAAHGIRGEVVIRSYTAEPKDIAAYGPLEDESGRIKIVIGAVRASGKGIVARIIGVADRNEAEKLAGTKLYVARERLPEASDGEFYHADLIGLSAVDGQGAVIGKVVAVVNYGASDLLEIRLAGSGTIELVPFTSAFVTGVDLAERTITVLMPVETAGEDEENGESDD
jgi:16S rRNA processing protein RimM